MGHNNVVPREPWGSDPNQRAKHPRLDQLQQVADGNASEEDDDYVRGHIGPGHCKDCRTNYDNYRQYSELRGW